MIVEILVTGGQAQHALGHQFAKGMLDKEGLARVAKTSGKTAGQSQGAIEFTQQEQTTVAAENIRSECSRAPGLPARARYPRMR